ncbi:MAG: hypothetical protein J4224_00130 [Candidatus Diapherotrites archaeon]|uniref:Hydrogenase maturation protease n=1 Tax=Candidatus Iainarchaeum sp. TaxID=3101447 RepID=A0A7J4IVS0_9ARCH|nr:MAG: hypothetical protein QT03_C0001G0116 [archaeon GW2011_AR10]MBS3058818.1 hypothetical protein [Candidatus Diapherotrites archaeon]HIH08449.1 hypothetical protein [Candidatus Diapherotrites archaeon]
MKVLVFGNPLVEQDSMPFRLLPKLRKAFPAIEFKEFDPAEDLQEEGRNLTIIDSIEGIEEVRVLTDTDKIETQRVYSLHDFDLGLTLKLLKKMGLVDSVTVIGVPMKGSTEKIFQQVKSALKEISITSSP